MQIRGEQHIVGRRTRQLVEETETFLDEPSIRPLVIVRNGLFCPMLRHRREWAEGMRRRRPLPNPTEQSRYDDILFAL